MGRGYTRWGLEGKRISDFGGEDLRSSISDPEGEDLGSRISDPEGAEGKRISDLEGST
jgi:hypothetical protein